MRYLVCFWLASLLGCQGSHREQASVANAQFVDTVQQPSVTARKWVEYKKVPVASAKDTLPYPDCYIVVKSDSFFYYRYNKLYEKQRLVLDKRYVDLVYTFSRKPGDLLIFEGKQRERCLLKRDYFEGDYEYFKLLE